MCFVCGNQSLHLESLLSADQAYESLKHELWMTTAVPMLHKAS